jgi:hypothetical protein
MSGNAFVVHRLRSKPVEYSVDIRHFVVAGEWTMGVTVRDVADDAEGRRRVAADLRRAAEMIDADNPVSQNVTPEPQ